MTKKQKDDLIDALMEMCERVAEGKATSEKEIAVLPKVAELLLEYPVARFDEEQMRFQFEVPHTDT